MARSPFPRSRGGRGPQIGTGTFLGRTSTGLDRPPVFSHLAWSIGATSPDTEMWCFLNTTVGIATEYGRISPTGTTLQFAWLEQVTGPDEFVPPASQPAFGNETEYAFKDYAVARMLSIHSVLTSPADWTVRVARPYPFPDAAINERRFKAGMYRVRQADRSADTVAWVWVAPDGSREVWFYNLLGSPEGFAYVGLPLPGTSIPYTSTRLWYTEETAIPYQRGPVNGAFIADLKSRIKTAAAGLVQDVSDLEHHDYRIGPDV